MTEQVGETAVIPHSPSPLGGDPEVQKGEPPHSFVPLAPAQLAGHDLAGYHVRTSWQQAPAGIHEYVIDVLAAAVASEAVWQAMAEAVLAGLCFRCSRPQDREYLLDLHVVPVVLEHADGFTWAHAPIAGLTCRGCDRVGTLSS